MIVRMDGTCRFVIRIQTFLKAYDIEQVYMALVGEHITKSNISPSGSVREM